MAHCKSLGGTPKLINTNMNKQVPQFFFFLWGVLEFLDSWCSQCTPTMFSKCCLGCSQQHLTLSHNLWPLAKVILLEFIQLSQEGELLQFYIRSEYFYLEDPQIFQNLFLIGQSKMMIAKTNSKLRSHLQLFNMNPTYTTYCDSY